MPKDNLNNKIESYLIKNKNKIKINSNDIKKNDVFVALQGKKTHGNNYIKNALSNGAKYIISDKEENFSKSNLNILIVNNCLKYLEQIAIKKRNKFLGQIIGITGSVGKTSVKENLNFFLSKFCNVSASIKSYNNYLGVILSMINIDNKSRFAIFEIGTNNFKEIGKLTSLIMPHQAIITNIFPTHLEKLKNTKNIAKEKSDIFNKKFNPFIKFFICPNSNEDECNILKKAKKEKIEKITSLGIKSNSEYFIKKINNENKFYNYKITNNNKIINIKTNKNLYHHIYNILICYIIFKYNNLDSNIFINKNIKVLKIKGRGYEKKIYFHNKKINFIDESYNASPETMSNCIDYFYSIKTKKNNKKFLVLGDMNELGTSTNKFHKEIVKKILFYKIENVILCGQYFKLALNNMKINTNNIKYILNENKILQFLRKKIHNNDTLLIKCSNSTKVNNLANILINKQG